MATESVSYKCPSCGSSLEFDAFTGNFTCRHCGSAFTKEELDTNFGVDELTISQSFDPGEFEKPEQAADGNWDAGNNLYNCPSCGAGIITDSATDVSVRCHYCNSPVVLAGRLTGEYRPDRLIPFSKTREFAEETFKTWSKKFFVPKSFRSERTLAEMKGVYVPFWLADSCVEGELEALCTNSTSVRHGDTVVTTHKEYRAIRNGSIICRGVPADGSSKAADLLMENIEPFDYSAMVNFDMSYLSGHNAEKYDIGKEQMFPRIKQRVCEEAETVFRETIKGYNTVRVVKKNFNITGVNWTYALLPVWFLSYKYKNELYCFAMNGQTGKFSGRLPLNKLKLAICALILALGIGGLGVLFAWLGGL